MSKHAFVISTKIDTEEYSHLKSTIDNITKYHPNSTIVIVDSCSLNKAYMQEYKNIQIEDICNKNYEYGAIMHGFTKYKEEHDTFMFMQDSVCLTGDINHQIQQAKDNAAVVIQRSFDPGYGDYSYYNSLKNHVDTPISTPISIYNTFVINTVNMQKLIDSTFFANTIPPVNKYGSTHWERLFSICWTKIGIGTIVNGNNITKTCLGRQ